jgi:hypothetical protein
VVVFDQHGVIGGHEVEGLCGHGGSSSQGGS